MNTPLREVVADEVMQRNSRIMMRLDWLARGELIDVAEFRSDVAAALRTPASEGDGGRVVATVDSFTNGSYWRNYKLTWHHDVPAGTKLYTTPPTQQEARAVALLREVAEWIDGWEPNFVDDAEWPAVAERIQAITQPGSPK